MADFVLTPAAKQLILDYEVSGGQKYYEKRLIHPEWPKGHSGVTIGVGYDLGQVKESEFQADWGTRLPPADFNRLKASIGVQGAPAGLLIPGLKDISVPWNAASAVFFALSVPKYWRQTKTAFPGVEKLPPDAQGALLSLVFNRGPGMSDGKVPDSRKEMRAIRDLVPKGDLKGIAAQLRSMKRLWVGKGQDGLLKRRDAEAKLVENAKGDPLTAPNNDATLRNVPAAPGVVPTPQTYLV